MINLTQSLRWGKKVQHHTKPQLCYGVYHGPEITCLFVFHQTSNSMKVLRLRHFVATGSNHLVNYRVFPQVQIKIYFVFCHCAFTTMHIRKMIYRGILTSGGKHQKQRENLGLVTSYLASLMNCCPPLLRKQNKMTSLRQKATELLT